MKPNWRTCAVDEKELSEFSSVLDIDKFTASILLGRGITNINDAYHFLNPKLSALHSPFLMNGMYKGVMRVREAVSKKEKIGIFADSDVDGLTSLAILVNLLERMGVSPSCRFAVEDEDYGLKKNIIDEFLDKGVNLLITLDCGIRDTEEIAYAKGLGIDVIVCDHHEQKSELPEAVIINPKLWDSNYPFKELAGVGVTFKLCHAILMSYLQSFDKLFIIIAEEEGNIFLSFIRNGIVEKIKVLHELREIAGLKDEIPENSCLVIFDPGLEELLSSLVKDIAIFSFRDLLNTVPDKKISLNASIEDLCRIFSINQKVFSKKHQIVNIAFSEIEYYNSSKITDYLNSIIDLVSVGTVADIMPLAGENRTIIHYGLKSLNSTVHPGLSLLVKNIAARITAKRIAWDISPLLNTPGRFGKTDLIAQFFLEKDSNNLGIVYDKINQLNKERKKFISELFETFNSEILNGLHITGNNLIFIASDKVPDGLCGLLANRLADSAGMPVIIISLFNGKELVKGSGRTTCDYNFFSIAESCSHLFEKIGGHKQAFGFTISRDRIDYLKKYISDSIGTGFIQKPDFMIDLDIPIEVINHDFINNLELLEPYGHKNDECLFLTRKAVLKSFKRFGKKYNHGKYIFQNNRFIEAIGWDMAETMERYMERGEVDVIYKLENNVYNGRVFPRMLIVDLD